MIHCGEDTLKDIYKHVDGVPNLSKVKFNDLTHCKTCRKANLTKSPTCHHSLHDSLTTLYHNLYVEFGLPGCIYKDREGKIIEFSHVDIEGLNGQQA